MSCSLQRRKTKIQEESKKNVVFSTFWKDVGEKKPTFIEMHRLKCQAKDVNFLPIEEGVVEVFTEALQNPVVIPDGGSLILTGRKVTLQLTKTQTNTATCSLH